MAETQSNLTDEYMPRGYCPRCDYPTDTGTCAECGFEIAPAKLRRRPRGWLRRHVRLVTALTLVIAVCGWLVVTRPQFNRWLPTSWLLVRQAGQGPHATAATDELAVRYLAGTLSPNQTAEFVRRWAHITWAQKSLRSWWLEVEQLQYQQTAARIRADTMRDVLLYTLIEPRRFPTRARLTPFGYEVSLIGVRLDGESLSTDVTWTSKPDSPPPCPAYFMVGMPPSAGGVAAGSSGLGLLLQGAPNAGLSIHSCSLDRHVAELDVNVAVSELVTGKQMAQWCETFRVEIDAVDVAGLPLTIRSNLRRSSDHEQGQEDLMFPYGRIPGRVAPLPDTLQHVDLPSTGG